MKGLWFAYAMMWVAVSVAVSIGLYFTKNFNCLWFLLIPSFVSLSQKEDNKEASTEEEDSEEEKRK